MNYKMCIHFILILGTLLQFDVTEGTNFQRRDLCDVSARLANKCMRKVGQSKTAVSCCIHCDRDVDCVGASLQINSSSCYLHSQCSAVGGCSKPDNTFIYYQRKRLQPLTCVNGQWNKTTETCDCTFYWFGELCDRYPYDCVEMASRWLKLGEMAETTVQPPDVTRSFAVLCGWDSSTYFFRINGSYGFNNTWKNYVSGFGPEMENFFVGLDSINMVMGSEPRELILRATFSDKSEIEDKYTGAVIGNSSTNYRLRFDTHTRLSNGSSQTCLELSNMTSFSTYDADHDGDVSVNWAQRAGCGWWFPARNFTCNILGTFYRNISPPPAGDKYIRFPGVSRQRLSSLSQFEMLMLGPK
jgi:hypothetical protein